MRIIGAELAGSIIVNMTFLKDEGLIEPVSAYNVQPGQRTPLRFYSVEFDLVVIVNGRNLRYEARWPKSLNVESEGHLTDNVVAQGQICIAASFKPGTA